MRKILPFFTALILVTSLAGAAEGGTDDVQPGGKTQTFPFVKNPAQSYRLYYPKSYDPGRKHNWPVLFLLVSDTTSLNRLELFKEGADRNQFFVVTLPCGVTGLETAVNFHLSMFDEVLKKYPFDPSRCYLGAFGDQVKAAFVLSEKRKRNIVGILGVDGGYDEDKPYNERVTFYGLCHAFAPLVRTVMVETCKNLADRKNGKLRFLPGSEAPDFTQIAEGMDWLNWQYLANASNPSLTKSFNDEKAAFAKRLAARIQADRTNRPEEAYDWCQLLAQLRGVPEAAAAKDTSYQLTTNPQVRLYLEATKEFDNFVQRNCTMVTSAQYQPNGKVKNQQRIAPVGIMFDSRVAGEAQKLQNKYGNTPFGEILPSFYEALAEVSQGKSRVQGSGP